MSMNARKIRILVLITLFVRIQMEATNAFATLDSFIKGLYVLVSFINGHDTCMYIQLNGERINQGCVSIAVKYMGGGGTYKNSSKFRIYHTLAHKKSHHAKNYLSLRTNLPDTAFIYICHAP